ncbi:MAG: hypothetical protein OXF54_03810 [Caldilineaceae bacterium]|nr:hypothetical protein [Caldilineaceae bacterium]
MAEDVRYYGKWMRDEAEKRIGHLYPKMEVTEKMAAERPDLKRYVGRKLTVIAWLWARTVRSPNPAFADVEVPLASTFVLSKKKGKEAYVEPVIKEGGYHLTVKVGTPPESSRKGTKLSRGANFRCLMSGVPMPPDYIKAEGVTGRMGERLMAIVAEGDRGRVYLTPTLEHELIVFQAKPEWEPRQDLPNDPRAIWVPFYGLTTFADLFTDRQLVVLTTFSALVSEAGEQVRLDAVAAGLPDDGVPLREGGFGATAYAEAVVVYLSLLVNQIANHSSTICGWNNVNTQMRSVFARQAIPMVWDYAESNPFCESSGSYANLFERQLKGFETLGYGQAGAALQADVTHQSISSNKLISTDPPYYDNIGYADLSDFFYVWLRRTLRQIFPEIFATLEVPKSEELMASPYRHGSKKRAESFFLGGMTRAMNHLAKQTHRVFPIAIYYAFKQSERIGDPGTISTGWESFLEAVIEAGLSVVGTWPIRTEKKGRVIGINSNALASSIVLVCRTRPANAPMATRREFIDALREELPESLLKLKAGSIAPVDLRQASIGPGMSVFTRYAHVLDVNGKALSVRDALSLIVQTMDESLVEQEGDLDADTRWAIDWFAQEGFTSGEFGVAETLSKAMNTSEDGLVTAGIIESGGGKVRLLRPDELPDDWDPETDTRRTVWEMVHHLIRVHSQSGEPGAAELLAKLRADAESARELAYRLYRICEQKNRAQEALGYNALVQSWPEIARLARERPQVEQATLLSEAGGPQ